MKIGKRLLSLMLTMMMIFTMSGQAYEEFDTDYYYGETYFANAGSAADEEQILYETLPEGERAGDIDIADDGQSVVIDDDDALSDDGLSDEDLIFDEPFLDEDEFAIGLGEDHLNTEADEEFGRQTGIRTVTAELEEAVLYDILQEQTEPLEQVNKLWKWYFDREAREKLDIDEDQQRDANGEPLDPLRIEVTGHLPENITAEAEYIAFDEGNVYSESALFSFQLGLYDENGVPYIPEEELTVTVGGRTISETVEGERSLFVYAWEEDEEREQIARENGGDLDSYMANVLVYRDYGADEGKTEQEVKDSLHYETGRRDDDIVFTEDQDGLTVTDDVYGSHTIRFETENMPLQFIVTASEPERTLVGWSDDGWSSAFVKGTLSEDTAVDLHISQANAANALSSALFDSLNDRQDTSRVAGQMGDAIGEMAAKAGNGEVLFGFEVSLLDEDSGEYQPDAPVEVRVNDVTIGDALDDGAQLELWALDENGQASQVTDAVFDEDTVTFDAQELGAYTILTTVFEKTITASDGQTYRISVTYDQDAGIPAGSELAVSEITQEEDENAYDTYLTETARALGVSTGSVSYARMFDISIVKNGQKVELGAPVDVRIKLMGQDGENADGNVSNESLGLIGADLAEDDTDGQDDAVTDGEVSVVHFGDETEVIDCAAQGDTIEFSTDGFSVYVVAYTVDFHWGEYTYNLAGGSEILLSELLKILANNVQENEDFHDVGDTLNRTNGSDEVYAAAKLKELVGNSGRIEDVVFSNPELLEVVKDGEDWILRSLKAFNTDEVLTITLENGEEIKIHVTDEQASASVEIRFVQSIDGIHLPSKTYDEDSTFGYKVIYSNENYIPKNNQVSPEAIVEDLIAVNEINEESTLSGMEFWRAYSSSETTFGNYVNSISRTSGWHSDKNGNSVNGDYWQFDYRYYSGPVGNNKLVIYFTQPAYLTIVNNSGVDINSYNLHIVVSADREFNFNADDITCYLLVNNNSYTRITDQKLNLSNGHSITVKILGGIGLGYRINGGFSGNYDNEGNVTIPFSRSDIPGNYELINKDPAISAYGNIWNMNVTGTLTSTPITVTFGDSLSYICKVTKGTDEKPFTSLRAAMDYIRSSKYGNSTATIEMLIDNYNLPEDDSLTGSYAIKAGENITLTTAGKDAELSYPYTGTGITATITRGYDGDSMIIAEGAITLSNIILDGNKNNNTSTSRGGIVFVGVKGSLTMKENTGETILKDSKVSFKATRDTDNKMTYPQGGAVYVNGNGSDSGSFTMNGGTISGCVVEKAEGDKEDKPFGGAVYLANGSSMTMANGAVTDCTARNGAGIYVSQNSKLTFTGGTVSKCNAANNGGGVYTEGGTTVVLGGVNVENCSAKNGGGIYLNGGETKHAVGSTVEINNNAATGNGGGVFVNTGAIYETDANAHFYSNKAKNGGAIWSAGSLKLDGDTIIGDDGRTNAAVDGGALYVSGGTSSILGSTLIQYNQAVKETGDIDWTEENGGAIYLDSGTLDIGGSAILENNIANGRGGAVYTAGGTVNIYGECELSTNTARNSQGGGAIYLFNSKDADMLMTMTGGVISNNRVETVDGVIHGTGGGVRLGNSVTDNHPVTFNMSSGIISGNAAEDGGAVCMFNDSVFTMTGGTISNNNALTNGGGIYQGGIGALSISNATFKENTAGLYGGAVRTSDNAVNAAKVTIENTTFTDNTSNNSGGAIYAWSRELEIKNSTITGSTSGWVGGAMAFGGGAAIVDSCTITDNKSAGSGAALYVYGENSTLSVKDGMISQNSSTAVDGGAVTVDQKTNKLYFSGNAVVYDNPSAGAKQQKNVVLSFDTNSIINTTADGLGAEAKIGVYVPDSEIADKVTTLFEEHGDGGMPFGTFASDANLQRFLNDRLTYYYGVKGDNSTICWINYVCKLTTAGDELLFTDAAHTTPAVYDTLEKGFAGAAEVLYRFGGSSYANTEHIKLKMLRDVTVTPLINKFSRELTFTTAETDITTVMDDNGDYFTFRTNRTDYTKKIADVGDMSQWAMLTRTSNSSAMFTWRSSGKLQVSNLIFDGANIVSDANGSALRFDEGRSGNADVKNSVFLHFKGSTGTIIGGAIVVNDNAADIHLKVDESIFCGCSAVSGGAVALRAKGTLEIRNSQFYDCYTTRIDGDNGNGGAVYINSTAESASTGYTAKITGCTFVGHLDSTDERYSLFHGDITAGVVNAQYGGGVQSYNGKLYMEDCDLVDCTAYEGGAIRIHNTNATVRDIRINGHYKLPATVYNSTGTESDGMKREPGGGGIAVGKDSTLTLDSTGAKEAYIRNCTAALQGGSIFITKEGGNNPTVTITGYAIDGYYAVSATDTTKEFSTTLTSGAVNAPNGGGIFVNSGTLNIGAGTVIRSCVSNGNGGGIYIAKDAKLNMLGGTIAGNTANSGGGIYTEEYEKYPSFQEATATLTITGGEIFDNIATNNGGGLFVGSGRMANISHLTMGGNKATAATIDTDLKTSETNGNGGAIYIDMATLVNINNSTIGTDKKPNEAYRNGGGIYVFTERWRGKYSQVGKLHLTDTTIHNNTAAFGGGIGEISHSIIWIDGDSVISNNHAVKRDTNPAVGAQFSPAYDMSFCGGGIGLLSGSARLTMTGGTISGNTAANLGGGLYIGSNPGTIEDSVIAGDTRLRPDFVVDSYGVTVLDKTVIKGNSAVYGGGLYAGYVTLQNGVTITDNTTTRWNNSKAIGEITGGAGAYVTGTLTLGQKGSAAETTTIKGNHTTDGINSNLCLTRNSDQTTKVKYNNTNNIKLNCKFEGKIWVSDPGDAYTQFGISGNRSFLEPVNADIFNTFSSSQLAEAMPIAADDESELIGRMEPADTNSLNIIWWRKPVCKITDGDGKLLYHASGSDSALVPAVFTALYDPNGADTVQYTYGYAFSLLNNENPQLFYANGNAYDGTVYYVKMLDDYTLRERIWISTEGKTITLTTASRTASKEDGYPYSGSHDKSVSDPDIAVIYRGKTFSRVNNNFFFRLRDQTDLSFEDITLDGGAVFNEDGTVDKANSIITYIDGPFVNLYDQATLRIESGATLQNSYADYSDMMNKDGTKRGGGAICHGYVSNGTTLIMSGGTIKRCVAETNGGAISHHTSRSATIITGGEIVECGAYGNGGAIYLQNANNSLTIQGGTIRDCYAANGGGIYLDDGAVMTIQGELDYSGNYSMDATAYAGYSSKMNGGSVLNYQNDHVPTDIFVKKMTGNPAGAIVVNGDITAADGSVWVWIDNTDANPTHHKNEDQFAVISYTSTTNSLEKTLKAFRNARDDASTENQVEEGSGIYLTGNTGQDINDYKCAYWGPSEEVGSRRVILRKVAESTYDALPDAKFEIHKGSAAGALVTGTDVTGNADQTIFTSGESGVFFLGELAYGIYYVKETSAPSGYLTPADGYYFIITVDEEGVGYKYTDTDGKEIYEKTVTAQAG